MKVLMATDGSVHASAAMLAASRFLRLTEADVDVVSVASGPPTHGSAHDPRHRAFRKRITEGSKRILDDAQRILALAHVRTHAISESGSPADRLLALAPAYDLAVLGAYGNHDRRQPGLGPVSSRFLQASRGNVLIGRELTNEENYRVLFALDSSEASFSALRALGTLFDPAAIEVTVMHVLETAWVNPEPGQSSDDGLDVAELSEYQEQLEREMRRTAKNVVESALQQLERWSIPASPIVAEGDPALELCSQAEQGGYDLVIAGATGASDVKHALLGSVSLKIAWDVPCSVAIIRQS